MKKDWSWSRTNNFTTNVSFFRSPWYINIRGVQSNSHYWIVFNLLLSIQKFSRDDATHQKSAASSLRSGLRNTLKTTLLRLPNQRRRFSLRKVTSLESQQINTCQAYLNTNLSRRTISRRSFGPQLMHRLALLSRPEHSHLASFHRQHLYVQYRKGHSINRSQARSVPCNTTRRQSSYQSAVPQPWTAQTSNTAMPLESSRKRP